MIIKLESCQHVTVEAIRSETERTKRLIVTCLTCYRRLSIPPNAVAIDRSLWSAAPAPPVCGHADKRPVQKTITAHRAYHDAMCVDCGKVLRHPDGKGEWVDVRFYDYLITELDTPIRLNRSSITTA